MKNKAEKETYNLIKSFLFILENNLIKNHLIQIDLTTHRNINGFDFPAEISSLKRNELKNILQEEIQKLEPIVFQRIKNSSLLNTNDNENEEYFEKGYLYFFY